MSTTRTTRLRRVACAALVAVAALAPAGAAGAETSAQADAVTAQAPTTLKVVTANLAWRGQPGVREDWKTIGANADIVFVQEAKNVNLREALGDGWIVRQDTSNDAVRGSAVVVRRSSVASVGALRLVKGVDESWCPEPGGILTRWIAKVDVQLTSGTTLTAASLHMPPPRCAWGPGSPYARMADNVVQFANNNADGPLILGADWNKVVDADPNDIGTRAKPDLKPRGPDTGKRIDGFYVSESIATRDLHYLAETGSDHRPVQMVVTVP